MDSVFPTFESRSVRSKLLLNGDGWYAISSDPEEPSPIKKIKK